MGFITYSCLYRNGWLGDNIIVKSIDELIDHYVKEITNNIIFKPCFPIEYEQLELKKYIKRFMNALKICGGFSLNETTLIENAKWAMIKVIQDDFESFKSEILLQFGMN